MNHLISGSRNTSWKIWQKKQAQSLHQVSWRATIVATSEDLVILEHQLAIHLCFRAFLSHLTSHDIGYLHPSPKQVGSRPVPETVLGCLTWTQWWKRRKVERKWSSPLIGKAKLLVFVLTLTPHDATGLTQLHLYPMAMTAWWRRYPDIVRLFTKAGSQQQEFLTKVFLFIGEWGGGQIGEID